MDGGSDKQPIQVVLEEKHFENTKLLNTSKEELIIVAMELPYKIWIN
jgi:hypothetical protein